MALQTEVLTAIQAPPNSIPEKFRPGLDPEWVALWTEYGSKVIPASQVTVEEFRKCPQNYSFTYPTCRGMLCLRSYIEDAISGLILITGPDVFQVKDVNVPVSSPAGEITCRVYTPEGPGPFPVHMNMHGGM